MAHEITRNSLTGEWEVMTRGSAWHKLGQVVQDAQTWQETMRLAGLDWTVSKQQLSLHGEPIPAWGVFRDDLRYRDAAKAFLSTASDTYELIQNEYMFAFLDAILEADGKAHYESAGSLNGGAQVWALVNLGMAFEIVAGDRHETYLCFTEDRTGQRAAKCFMTSVRVVCANTLSTAYGKSDDQQSVKFRHTKSIGDRMNEAINLFTGARQDVGLLRAKLERLSQRQMTARTLTDVLETIFPAETEKQANSKVREERMKAVLDLYADNDSNAFPEVRGTAYNLLNAMTEYVDHYAPVRRTKLLADKPDNYIRADRAIFGAASDLKTNMLDALLVSTENNPTVPKTVYIDQAVPSYVDGAIV